LDLHAVAAIGFAATPHRVQFVGHYHCWWATTERGPIAWDGSAPLLLPQGVRCFVVLGAVAEGHCAVYDTETGWLEPLK